MKGDGAMAMVGRFGLILGFLSLVGIVSGCASTSEDYSGSGLSDFQKYKATRPVPKACETAPCVSCRPPDRDPAVQIHTGDADVDLMSDSVEDMYTASVHKLDSYIELSEKSRTWAAFCNDVDACQKAKKTDEEKEACIDEVFNKLSPEDQKEVIAFQQANANIADENLRMLVGLAKMSASVAGLATRYKDKSFSMADAAAGVQAPAAVAVMTTKVTYMESTQRFYKQQQARMEYLKGHAGR